VTATPRDLDELDIAAAQVAAAILEFMQLELPEAIRYSEELSGRIGDVGFRLYPDEIVVPKAEAPLVLLELPKPVAIANLGARGLFGTWRMDPGAPHVADSLELAREANQIKLKRSIIFHHLHKDSRVHFESAGMRSVFPVDALARLFRDYLLFVTWVLRRPQTAEEPHMRLMLVRADGLCSTGERVRDARAP